MRKKSVHLLAVTSVIASIICIIGLILALEDYFDSSQKTIEETTEKTNQKSDSNQTVNKDDGQLRVVALGDSLTRGSGDSEGKGYVGNVISQLEEKSKRKVLVTNLGVNGFTSEQLVAKLEEKEVKRQISTADYVFFTIGGNDLFRGGQGLNDMSEQVLKPITAKYEENLKTILSRIRSLNNEAPIYFLGLYNPFIELEQNELTSKVVRLWNYQSAEIAAQFPKTVFVPTFDLFQLNVYDYLYSDQFHPNSKGYRLIAERISSLISMEQEVSSK